MPTAPESSQKSNRKSWIVVGVLGCVVMCLLGAFIAAAVYFVFLPQQTAIGGLPSPTRVSFGLPTATTTGPGSTTPSATGTAPVAATPVAVEPSKTVAPTRAPQPTSPFDVVGVPTTAPGQPPAQPTPPSSPPTKTAPPPTATRPAGPTGKIAFSKNEGDNDPDKQVWIMNADGTGAKKILDRASHPAISPDGTKIVYYHWKDGIYVANIDGTDPKKILGETFSGGDYGSPAWSHDGRFVAFSAQPGGKGNIVIDTVPPDGSVLKDSSVRRNIAVGEGPTWSPDDTQIAFHTCRSNICGIYKSASAPGSEAIPVAGDDGGLPSWSPDGKRLVYQKDQDGQKQLFVINVDGSGKKQLTSGASMHVDAIWSTDGNYIFYRSAEGGNWAIWRMNADGSGQTKVLDNMAPVNWPYERLAVGK